MSLLVVTIGALVGTSIIYYSGADRRAAKLGVSRVQARAMAWSGVQVVLAELSKQRDALLSGEAPEITERWIAPSGEVAGGGGEQWGFRVMAVRGKTLWSEMGKLDVNSVPAEMLAKLPGMTEELAGKIVAARGTRRFTSVPELLSVQGMTPELLLGSGAGASTPAPVAPAAEGAEPSEAATSVSGGGGGGGGGGEGGLSRFLTVYSFDPEVQVGFGAKASEAAGKQRININVPWSDDLGEAIKDRFDAGIADGVKGLLERGEKFEKPSSIVKKLREFRVEPEGWVEVLDAFTTNPDQYRLGAVDLLTAPAIVLSCVPGITPEAASDIVARREKLDPTRRGTPVWPVLEGIMKPEEFELAADWLTSRCVQWRIVVEGGLFADQQDGVSNTLNMGATDGGSAAFESGDATLSGGLEGGPDQGGVQPLRDRVVLEAVLDVSSLRARVAYLRDSTLVPTARLLAIADAAREDRDGLSEQNPISSEETSPRGPEESSPDADHTELDRQALASQRLDREDGGGQEGEESGGEGDGRSAGAEPGAGGQEGSASAAPPAARDLRVGRWTPGSGGSKE
jgi:DNA uptake protein ComE-like DNA-binding protein